MSDTPKYCAARLAREQRERLERERERQAEEAAKQRKAAEERARKKRLEQLRADVLRQADHLRAEIGSNQNSLYPEDVKRLLARLEKAISHLQSSQEASQLREQGADIPLINREFLDATDRKRRDEEERKRRAEIDRQRFHLSESERRLSELSSGDSAKFDSEGLRLAQEAIAKAKEAIASGDPRRTQGPVVNCQESVGNHLESVARRKAEWLQRKAEAEDHLATLVAFVEGLKVDPVLMRWEAPSVASLVDQVQQATRAIQSEEFERPALLAEEARSQGCKIVEEANAAQVRADQRDYIARSIAQSLQAMGFIVGPIHSQDSRYLNSAVEISAANASGESIHVAVPVEGQVLYRVDGYPQETAATMGGGTARTCDLAETVLNEMRAKLEQQFGVETDEIGWEGKQPHDGLRTADALPTSNKSAKGGVR